MKRALPFVLIAALMLTGCKSGNGKKPSGSSTTTAPTVAATTTEAVTTAVTTKTTTTAAATKSAETTATTTAAVSTTPEEAVLIENGIIPPEAEEVPAETDTQNTAKPTETSDDAPIELPMIPIV